MRILDKKYFKPMAYQPPSGTETKWSFFHSQKDGVCVAETDSHMDGYVNLMIKAYPNELYEEELLPKMREEEERKKAEEKEKLKATWEPDVDEFLPVKECMLVETTGRSTVYGYYYDGSNTSEEKKFVVYHIHSDKAKTSAFICKAYRSEDVDSLTKMRMKYKGKHQKFDGEKEINEYDFWPMHVCSVLGCWLNVTSEYAFYQDKDEFMEGIKTRKYDLMDDTMVIAKYKHPPTDNHILRSSAFKKDFFDKGDVIALMPKDGTPFDLGARAIALGPDQDEIEAIKQNRIAHDKNDESDLYSVSDTFDGDSGSGDGEVASSDLHEDEHGGDTVEKSNEDTTETIAEEQLQEAPAIGDQPEDTPPSLTTQNNLNAANGFGIEEGAEDNAPSSSFEISPEENETKEYKKDIVYADIDEIKIEDVSNVVLAGNAVKNLNTLPESVFDICITYITTDMLEKYGDTGIWLGLEKAKKSLKSGANVLIFTNRSISQGVFDLAGKYFKMNHPVLINNKLDKDNDKYSMEYVALYMSNGKKGNEIRSNITGHFSSDGRDIPIDAVGVLLDELSKEGDVVLNPFLNCGFIEKAVVNNKRYFTTVCWESNRIYQLNDILNDTTDHVSIVNKYGQKSLFK